MERLCIGNLLDCFLMTCCSLYQNSSDINFKKSIIEKFPKNISIEELSNLTNIGIYVNNEFINSYLSKFVIMKEKNNKFASYHQKGKTIFAYNEISKNLLNLPDEIISKISTYASKNFNLTNKRIFEISNENNPTQIYTIFDKYNPNAKRLKLDEKNGIFNLSKWTNIEELYIHIYPDYKPENFKDIDKLKNLKRLYVLVYSYNDSDIYANELSNYRLFIKKLENLNFLKTLYLFQDDYYNFHNIFTTYEDCLGKLQIDNFRTNLNLFVIERHFKISERAGRLGSTCEHMIINCAGIFILPHPHEKVKTLELYNLNQGSMKYLYMQNLRSKNGKYFYNDINIIIHYTFPYKFDKYTSQLKANNGTFYCDKKYEDEIRKNLKCLTYTFYPSEEYKKPLETLEKIFSE